VVFDRANVAAIQISGAGNDSLSGSIDAPSANATVSGNSGVLQFNGSVVVSTLTLSGNGAITIGK
jgi:hypothetical protein